MPLTSNYPDFGPAPPGPVFLPSASVVTRLALRSRRSDSSALDLALDTSLACASRSQASRLYRVPGSVRSHGGLPHG